jgi:hypothetical protein
LRSADFPEIKAVTEVKKSPPSGALARVRQATKQLLKNFFYYKLESLLQKEEHRTVYSQHPLHKFRVLCVLDFMQTAKIAGKRNDR